MATVGALILGTSWQAGAQTPNTAPTTTTPNPLEDLLHKLLPTTTVPKPATTTAPTAPGGAPAKPGAPGAGPTTTTTPPGVVPPEFLPIINAVRRSGSSNSLALLAALRPLQDQGMTPEQAAIAGMGHFPVAGEAYWSDDWLEPRFGPPFHLHQGNDIFTARGTPVRATFNGVVRFADEGLGGKVAYLTVADGTYYYMAHLDAFSRTFSSGAAVKQGDIIGYAGDSGNAAGGSPHVHFEIHPGGGAAVDPKSILDGWIADAIRAAPSLLPAGTSGAPRVVSTAGLLHRFEDDSPGRSGRAVEPILWASSVSAGGGTLRLAEIQVARMAGHIDWDHRATTRQAYADALRQGRDAARAILGPITPTLLLPLLGGARAD